MNKYIAEFIGTFFLVLTIGCTGISAGTGVIAPLAIGAALMVMVFAGGHISGAHYNPAVTVGVFIRGKVNGADVGPYMVAQLAGAALAAVAVTKFLRAGAAVTPISPHVGPALLAEFQERDSTHRAGALIEPGELFGRLADGQMLSQQARHRR